MSSLLGRPFPDGAVIARQGDTGDCMFVIQDGRVELAVDHLGEPVPVALLGPGDFFGETCVFERSVRLATARAVGEARVLTVDRPTLLRRLHEDPSLAMHMLEMMARRIDALNRQLGALHGAGAGPAPVPRLRDAGEGRPLASEA